MEMTDKLNEAEEYHYKITGVKRRFHIDSFLGDTWLKMKRRHERENKQRSD